MYVLTPKLYIYNLELYNLWLVANIYIAGNQNKSKDLAHL